MALSLYCSYFYFYQERVHSCLWEQRLCVASNEHGLIGLFLILLNM